MRTASFAHGGGRACDDEGGGRMRMRGASLRRWGWRGSCAEAGGITAMRTKSFAHGGGRDCDDEAGALTTMGVAGFR